MKLLLPLALAAALCSCSNSHDPAQHTSSSKSGLDESYLFTPPGEDRPLSRAEYRARRAKGEIPQTKAIDALLLDLQGKE